MKTISTILLILMVLYWMFIILCTPLRTYPALADFEVFPIHMFMLGVSNLITTLIVFLLIRSLAGKLEKIPTRKPVTRMCPNCGRVPSEEAKFCPYCGKELG